MSGDHNMNCSANTKCPRCGKENPAEIHTCTPLALRLADSIQHIVMTNNAAREAAAELRRLYEVNVVLEEALRTILNVSLMDNSHWVKTIETEAWSALAKAKGNI